MSLIVPVTYDIENCQKIPSIWKKTLVEIIESLKNKDILRLNSIKDVEQIDILHAQDIFNNVDDYGITLISIPNESWNTSVCQYFGGGWNIYIDLYAKEAGLSDLIMSANVFEVNKEFIFRLDNIYVP